MSNEHAARYMDHIAFHGYDCQFNCTKTRNRYQDIERLHQEYPELEILMTEICYAYNGDDPNCMHKETMKNCTDWPRNTSLAPSLPRLDFSDGKYALYISSSFAKPPTYFYLLLKDVYGVVGLSQISRPVFRDGYIGIFFLT